MASDRVTQFLTEAFSLWIHQGFSPEKGQFREGLDFHGQPMPGPHRSMVQARQLYSFRVALDRSLVDRPTTLAALKECVKNLEVYSLPSGGFLHSLNEDGSTADARPDLYTQAFLLFGLANFYALEKDSSVRERALKLLDYLRRERAVAEGGFTEISPDGKTLYASNPHMHLFEAALAWVKEDPGEPRWRQLAEELCRLATTRFVDASTGLLAEYFDEKWTPVLDAGARFVWEPGHQFEWAWLFAVHDELMVRDTRAVRAQLFAHGEKMGLRGAHVFDEVWSDGEPKKRSSRYWPHCERVKAAVRLGLEHPNRMEAFAESADDALESLFRYLEAPVRGLCFDAIAESGQISAVQPKASCFYHVVNAMDEYARYRPSLKRENRKKA